MSPSEWLRTSARSDPRQLVCRAQTPVSRLRKRSSSSIFSRRSSCDGDTFLLCALVRLEWTSLRQRLRLDRGIIESDTRRVGIGGVEEESRGVLVPNWTKRQSG